MIPQFRLAAVSLSWGINLVLEVGTLRAADVGFVTKPYRTEVEENLGSSGTTERLPNR